MKRKLLFSLCLYFSVGVLPLLASSSSVPPSSKLNSPSPEQSSTRNEHLSCQHTLRLDHLPRRICFSTRSGFVLIREEELISISVSSKGEGLMVNYRKNGQAQQVYCQTTLSKVRERLAQFPFVKVSRKSIVNMDQVDRFEGTKRNAHLLLSNGESVKVSRNLAVQIYDWLDSHSI